MTDLSEKLLKAVQDELPAATAGEMRKYIEKAQATEEELKRSQEVVKTYSKELDVLRPIREKEANLSARETAVATREQAATLKEEILKIREEHAKQRVDEIRGLTNTVFQSNRLAYNLNLDLPNPNYNQRDAYGNQDYQMTKPAMGKIEKE